MKALSKILSIFLSLALVASFMPTFALTASAETEAAPVEAIVDGTFESGTINSQVSSNATIEIASNTSYPGSGKSLKVTTGDSTGATWKDTKFTFDVNPSGMYSVSFYFNTSSSSTGIFQYYVQSVDGQILAAKTALSRQNKWQTHSVTFSVPEGVTQAVMVFNVSCPLYYLDTLTICQSNAEELIYNGGFDGGVVTSQMIPLTHNYSVASDDSGNYYLTHTQSGWSAASFGFGVEPGKKYEFSFKIKAANVQFKVGSNIFGSSTAVLSQMTGGASASKYTTYSAVITAPADTYKLWLWINGSGTTCIDDVSVKEYNLNKDVERIENGNFVTNTISDQWSTTGTMAAVSNEERGNYSIKLNTGDTTGATWKDTTVQLNAKPDTTYAVSFWYKPTSYNAGTLQYYINTATGAEVVAKTAIDRGYNAWNYHTFNFTSPSIETALKFVFNLSIPQVYIDGFSIIEIGKSELIYDGGFENGEIQNQVAINLNDAWSATTTNPASGSYSLEKTTTGWANINYGIGVEPGETYVLKFKAYGRVQYKVGTNIWGSNPLFDQVDVTSSDKYTEYTSTFTAPADTYKLWLLLNGYDETYIDDISVKKAITITATAEEGGEVFGAGSYLAGDTVTLTAVNKSGYDFAGWYKGETLVCEDEIYTFTATETAEYTAHFEAGNNLIANTGFETGSINWNNGYGPYLWDTATNWGRVSVTDDAHSGKYAVKFTEKEIDTTTNDNGSLIEQTVTVEENTDYLLTFWVKFDGSEGKNTNADAAYKINTASGTAVNEKMNSAASEWSRYAVVFNSGDGTIANIEFSGTLSDYVIDDVKLVKSNGGLIADGGFESGEIIGWECADGVLALDTEKANGNYSVKMNDDWSNSASLTAGVMADTTYELTFNVSREIASSANIKFSVASGVGEVLYNSTANELTATEESGEFVSLRAIFRSGVDSVNITLNSGDGAIWIDDFSITEFTYTGDANIDGAVNAADIVRVKKNVAQTGQVNNALAGDIDNNGKLDASDLSAIRLEFLEGSKKKSVVNRYEKIMSEDGMVYGINVPWFTKNAQGHNLSSGTLTGYSASFNYETAYNTLYNAKAIGFNSVNIWLFSGFEGIAFDENLNATGLKADFVENLTSILKIAEKLDMGLTFTVQPHFDGMSDPAYTGASTEAYAEYFQIVSDAAKRAAYMENAVTPVIELISQYESNIVSIIAYCEPELEYIGEYTQTVNTDAAATRELMKSFIGEISEISKSAMAEVPVGIALCSYANDSDYRDMVTNGTLEFIGYDEYNNDGTLPSISGKSGDTWVTECGVKSTEADYADNIANFFANARAAGYKAAYYWSYDSDAKTGIANFSNENRYNAVAAVYEYILARRVASGMLSEEELNTPVVLLDGEYVVMLAPIEGVYYQIHRYDSEKGAWVYDGVEFGNNISIGVYKPEIGGYYKVSNIVSSSEIYSVTVPYKY